MQGYLSIWSGILRWKPSFFILHNDVLTYCTQKGGQKQGAIHLKVASIVPVLDDPLKIHLHTGTNVIYLRAADINQKIRWVKALTLAQSQLQDKDVDNRVREYQNQNGFRSYQATQKRIQSLEAITIQIWNTQAELQDVISQILHKLKESITATRLCQRFSKLTNLMKHKSTQVLKILESQQTKLKNMRRNTKIQKIPSEVYIPQAKKNNQTSFQEYKSILQNKQKTSNMHNSIEGYVSFVQNSKITNKRNDITYGNDHPQFHSFINDNDYQNMNSKADILNISANQNYKTLNPYKKSVLQRIKIFSQILQKIGSQKSRQWLPVQIQYNNKINLLSVLKNLVGKDITRVSMPIVLNEPLSLLQKGCQQMYYSYLLDKANQENDSIKKLLYVMAFVVSQYSLTKDRAKKPFNPLLGQTYQYIDQVRNFRYISQQVSHHPPICAFQCQSHSFQYIGNSQGQSTFRGSLKFIPQTKSRINLKHKNESIIFNKCISSLNNIMVGNLYMDNYGDINFKLQNSKNHILARGFLSFKQCTIWGNNQYQVNGWIKDQNDIEVLKLYGKWSQQLFYYKKGQNDKFSIWRATHTNNPKNYYFNDYSINLNHLNLEMVQKIAPTDSRFRPDQRALQFNMIQEAIKQKQRLQQKQRWNKKSQSGSEIEYKPLWFNKKFNNQTKQFEYINNKSYWKYRKDKNWQKCLQIY